MSQANCIICANEFDDTDMTNVSLSNINMTKYKICAKCLELSDPSDDYLQARNIVNSYIKMSEAKLLLNEAQDIINSTLDKNKRG